MNHIKKQKQTTIMDIAAEAGVSKATVSNVLGQRSVPLSAETVRKVEEAAKRLGYRRNFVAASLSLRKTNELGLLVPSFGGYYGRFAEYMQAEAHKSGYHLSVFSASGSDPAIEKQHLEMLLQRRVDGLFCHGLAMSHESTRQLVGEGTPLVLFNAWGWPEDISLGAVNLDFAGAAEESVQHLLACGCGSVFYAGRRKARAIDEQRRIGFAAGVDKASVELPRDLLDMADYSPTELLSTVLERSRGTGKPAGIVAFDDNLAFQLLASAQRIGCKVPEQIQLIGINNDRIAKDSFPGLTTWDIPYKLQARTAIGLFLRQLGESLDSEIEPLIPMDVQEIPIPLTLVTRESTLLI
jgi:LacI family transcriptional regulator